MSSTARPQRVLAIDPGREKCGIAIVDVQRGVLARGVVPSESIAILAEQWAARHRPEMLLVGGGTALRRVRASLGGIELPLEVVPEAHTTRLARARYFEEHPPRGWRRLIPRGLLTPPVPVDDYAAVLIAEGYLAVRTGGAAQETRRKR